MDAEFIAITGISGRFPKCPNMDQFKKSLLSGADLITDDHSRWPHHFMNLPSRLGVVDLDRFDAACFGMNPKQADCSDPRTRILLEVVFECIVDSGFNPAELRGSKTGVFLAATQAWSNLGILSRSTSIMANTISYCFDFKGPSFALDSGCSSSLYAFDQALEALKSNSCDMAIVCAAQTHLDPGESSEFASLGVINPEGVCQTFEQNRNGYVKSDSVVAVFLQKSAISRRIYATVVGSGINVDGFKSDGIIHPSSTMQRELFRQLYQSNQIDSDEVEYLEAHGTGTKVGDLVETEALVDFFFGDGRRQHPLLVGGVKSNVGHAEAASGLVSLAKVILSIQSGIIPANLHCNSPDLDLPGLRDGKLKVVGKNTPLGDGLLAINSFGFGGTNAHLVLRPYHHKHVDDNGHDFNLVRVSGRTEEAVKFLLTKTIEYRNNMDFLTLIDQVFRLPIDQHSYRGYAILSDRSKREIAKCTNKRPIWFLYSGMGSQWAGMAKDLMRMDVFRATLKKCADAVRPFGINLEELVVNKSQAAFDDVVNCFTAITAMAVCLTDVLTSLGVQPDGIIGHSLGEVGCAYADGLITPEQATLIAYGRGYATKNSPLQAGLMVSVGLSAQDCQKRLPQDTFIACDNSQDNVTVSGPADRIQPFLQQLTEDKIFNKVVETANIAFHCKHIHEAGPKLLTFLEGVLPERRLRSKRWLPSAIPEDQYSTELGQYNSAQYHYYNYMNTVRFRQVLEKVPSDAIVIEIAPRGLLRAILRRNLASGVVKLNLSSNEADDNFEFLLASLGRLHNAGGDLNLSQFYKATLPVGIDTPFLGSLIKWDHTQQWTVPSYDPNRAFGEKFLIDVADPDSSYLEGHVVDGKLIYPGSGYMVLAWTAYAKMLGRPLTHLPIVIKNMKIVAATLLQPDNPTTLIVNIFKGTGNFEITRDSVIVATGQICSSEQDEFLDYSDLDNPHAYKIKLDGDDFYKELHLRGYDYYGVFKGIQSFDLDGRSAIVKWCDNWVAFLDAIMHHIVLKEQQGLFVPTKIDKVVIDPRLHLELEQNCILLDYNKQMGAAKCGGAQITGVHGSFIKRRLIEPDPVVQKYQFVPSFTCNSDSNAVDSVRWGLTVMVQVMIENTTDLTLRIAEISQSSSMLDMIKEVIPHNAIKRVTFEKVAHDTSKTFDLLVVPDVTKQQDSILRYTKASSFLLSKMDHFDESFFRLFELEVIHRHTTSSATFVLFRRTTPMPENCAIIAVFNGNFSWIEQVKEAMRQYQSPESRIYLVAKDNLSGVVGFFNCLRAERQCHNLRIVFVRNGRSEPFSMKSQFYADQLRKDLTVNVHQDGIWGYYKLLPMEKLQRRLVEDARLTRTANGEFQWVQSLPCQRSTKQNISVYYAALCPRATPSSSSNDPFAVEYAGFDDDGNKVMGLVPDGSLVTSLKPHRLSWPVPLKWNLESAATVPLCYTLAYYALNIKTQISDGDIVLTHGGSNLINMATITLLLDIGCKTYITTCCNEDAAYLKKAYPGIPEDNIIVITKSASDQQLAEHVKDKLSVVINCCSEELLLASLKCASKSSRFLQIASDRLNADNIADDLFANKCQFFDIAVSDIWQETGTNLAAITDSINNLIKAGVIQPLRYRVYDKTDIAAASASLEDDQIKCLIKLKNKNSFFNHPDNRMLALPRTYFNPNKCYIIVGGLGGFGLELANWMISRGATKLVLNCRRDISTGYQALRLQEWKRRGIAALTDTSDSTTLKGAENLLNFSINLGPIGGIFNTALILKDGMFNNQRAEYFQQVMLPKFVSAHNLDFLSRKMCPHLKHFVMFSSMVSSLGNAAQSNYGFANSAIERLCEARKAEGLPALAIQWGPIGDVGFVARLNTTATFLDSVPQGIQSCLNVLDELMQQEQPVVSSCVLAQDSKVQPKTCKSRTVLDSVAAIFGIRSMHLMDGTTKLINLGMDSLLSFEIKHMLDKEFHIDMAVQDIKNLTIDDLKIVK